MASKDTIAIAVSPYRHVLAQFAERLRAIPALRSKVREGLSAIWQLGIPVTVLTEECVERCRALLIAHDLLPFVTDVVSLHKTDAAYRSLRARMPEAQVLMIGDQLDRDIRAAHLAGFTTFFFPSGFTPYWNERVESAADFEISRYDEIVPFINGREL